MPKLKSYHVKEGYTLCSRHELINYLCYLNVFVLGDFIEEALDNCLKEHPKVYKDIYELNEVLNTFYL